MISNADILISLQTCDAKYQAALANGAPAIDVILYSKLAVIEYCGWIEMSQDLIVYRFLKNKLVHADNKVLDIKINKNYGFDYDNNFRPLLTFAIGLEAVASFEQHLNAGGKLQILKSELSKYKQSRDSAAHTMAAATTQIYQSPSIIIASLNSLFPILTDVYNYAIQTNP